MSPSATVAVVVVLLGAALASAAVALAPPAAGRRSTGPSWLRDVSASRRASAAVTFVLVLFATRWILPAVVAGVLVLTWGRLLRDREAEAQRARVEAIAKWLEDLRDVLRASSIGAEEALEQVATRPPAEIAVPLGDFLRRRRQGLRMDDALADLAADLAHPLADAALSAIRLVVGGSAGAGRLHPTVDALAAAARDEVRARERIDRTRAVYRGSMRRLMLIAVGLVGYLRLAGGDLLDPYASATGQFVLALPLGMWIGCVLWLRALCDVDQHVVERGGTSIPAVAP